MHYSQRTDVRLGLELGVLLLLILSCGSENTTKKQPVFPIESLAVSSSSVTVGFKAGSVRQTLSIDGFEITPSPITVGQYAACTKAGACRALGTPSESTTNATAKDDAVTALAPRDASNYCTWVGGTLPTLAQWLLAARGPTPRRFAWGEQLATCLEHPRGVNIEHAFAPSRDDSSRDERTDAAARARAAANRVPCGNSMTSLLAVGEHPAGASPKGLQDVLLAPAELLARDRETHFGACRGTAGFCSVYGMSPGAIDFVRPVEDTSSNEPLHSNESGGAGGSRIGFRCVWNERGSK